MTTNEMPLDIWIKAAKWYNPFLHLATPLSLFGIISNSTKYRRHNHPDYVKREDYKAELRDRLEGMIEPISNYHFDEQFIEGFNAAINQIIEEILK